MTATASTVAYGLTFKVTAGTNIIEMTSIDGPNVERDMIEVTHLTSPGQAKEFIAGLIDAGEITLSCNYLPQNTQQKALLTALTSTSATASNYTLTLTDSGASVITANFFVKSFKMKGEVAGKLAADFVLKGTGPVTFPT